MNRQNIRPEWARIFILTLFTLIIYSTQAVCATPPGPEHLAETMECRFTPDLVALADELDHDPVTIYAWVYDHIQMPDTGDVGQYYYVGSRLGAQSTYMTRHGNHWDTASLLITLLRISGIPARYVKFLSNDYVYVEAWLALDNYRNGQNGETMAWVPLVPWHKEVSTREGINLFENDIIPAELDFDFQNYLTTLNVKTPLEIFEKNMQDYLAANHPGKSLNDVPFKEAVRKRSVSLLPSTIPAAINFAGSWITFAEISSSDRISIDLSIKKSSDDSILLNRTVYLPEVAGRRFCLDFINSGSLLKPVFKLDGTIIQGGQSSDPGLTSSEKFYIFYTGGGYVDVTRPDREAGTFMQIALDPLAASDQNILKLKSELAGLSSDLVLSRDTHEEILGRMGMILTETFLYRMFQDQVRAADLMYGRISWGGTNPTFIYTLPASIPSDTESKFLLHPQWNIDAQSTGGFYKRRAGDLVWAEWDDPIFKLARWLYGYSASYNEGLIFEDWQDSPSTSTIKGIMLAYDQGIDVGIMTDADVPMLENLKNNCSGSDCLPAGTIQFMIDELNAGKTVIAPLRLITYEGMTGYVMLINGPTSDSYLFNMDFGGKTSETVYQDDTIDSYDDVFYVDEGLDDYVPGEIKSTYSVPDSGGQDVTTTKQNDYVASDVSPAGDPVNMATGEFYQEEKADFLIPSRGFPLSLFRKYKSRLIYNGMFGFGWTWNHAQRVVPQNNGDLIYYDNEGSPYDLTHNGDSTYTVPPGVTFSLIKSGDQYVLTKQDKIKFYFNSNGYLISKEDTFGNTLTFEYTDTAHPERLTAIKDALNRALTFTYNANGKVERVTDFSGRQCTYAYDGDDLITFTGLENNTTQFEYLKDQENALNDHNLKKYIMPNGDFLEIGYYKNDQVSFHRNKKGETFHFQYSRLNRYSETWNEEGYYRKVFFNENHDEIRVDNEDGSLSVKEYDEHHNVISHTDGNGNTTLFTYYPEGGDPALAANRNLYSKTNALSETWTYKYDSPNQPHEPSEMIDPEGNVTRFEYYANGKPHKKIEAPGNEYGSDGRLVENPAAPGFVTTYQYDVHGNLMITTDALNHSITRTYSSDGLYLTSLEDKNGHETAFEYYEAGNSENMPVGSIKSKTIKTILDPSGYTTLFEYNHYNQKTSETNALGHKTLFEYDENRKLVKTIFPNTAVTENIYDSARDIVSGAKIKTIIDPLGFKTHFTHDKLGNVIRKEDKKGNVRVYAYDAMSRLIEETDSLGHASQNKYDGNGNLVEKTDRRGHTTLFSFDSANRLVSTQDPEGHISRIEYYKNGQIKKKIDAVGIETLFEYNALNQVEQKTIGFGTADERIYQYRYDALGRVIKEILPLGNYRVYQYDNHNNRILEEAFDNTDVKLAGISYEYYPDNRNLLKTKTDANSHVHQYEYNALGQETAYIDPLTHRFEKEYDSVGNLILEKRPGESITRHAYDLNNQRIRTTNALGHRTVYEYDANGNRAAVVDPLRNVTRTYYDAENRKISGVDAKGFVTTFDYDENGNLTAQIDPRGYGTRYVYDRNNRPVKEINALGEESVIEYDPMGRVSKTIDARLTETVREYDDPLGKLTRITQAMGLSEETSTAYYYDLNGNKEEEINDLGITTHFDYDGLDRMITKTQGFGQPEAITTHYSYYPGGELQEAIDPRGQTTQYFYDPRGFKTKTIDPMTWETTWGYDERGNLLIETRPEGETIEFEYDLLDRKTKTITNSTEKLFFYDENSRLIREVNFNNVATVYSYDELGQLILKTEAKDTADEASTTYHYDENGNLDSITNARNKTVHYEYDELNRRKREIDADGDSKTVTYDANGNMINVMKRDYVEIQYTYDALNRKTYVTADSQAQQSFHYDPLSRLLQAWDYNNGRVNHRNDFEYDIFNRLKAETQDGKRVARGFDENGNITWISSSRGYKVQRDYDFNNALTSVAEVYSDTTNIGIAGYLHDQNNRVTDMTYENGVVLTLNYDSKGRESTRNYIHNALTLVYGAEVTEYDGQDNIRRETISRATGDIFKEYFYDHQDRLTREDNNGTLANWQYDTVGNWFTTDQNGVSETRLVNDDNEYSSITGKTPVYDQNGNMVSDGLQDYVYDWADRLIEVWEGGQIITQYSYDALNRRVTKDMTQTADVTTYVYHDSQVLEEITNGSLDITYVYGDYIDDPIMAVHQGNRYYFHKDRQFSIIAVTDSSANVVERYEYSAYGLMTIYDASDQVITDSTIGNPYGYTGRRFDKETGLWYYRNRMYSPELGRFMQRDPAGYVDGMCLYAYVMNNPLKYFDPFGLTAQKDYYTTIKDTYKAWEDSYVERHGEGFALPQQQTMLTELVRQAETKGIAVENLSVEEIDQLLVGDFEYWGTWERFSTMAIAAWLMRTPNSKIKAPKNIETPKAPKKVTREERWQQLAKEGKLSKQEIDYIKRHGGKGMQDTFGKELAHKPKKSAAQGHDYREASPKLEVDHRGLEHRYLKERKTGTTISVPKKKRSGGKLDLPKPGALPK